MAFPDTILDRIDEVKGSDRTGQGATSAETPWTADIRCTVMRIREVAASRRSHPGAHTGPALTGPGPQRRDHVHHDSHHRDRIHSRRRAAQRAPDPASARRCQRAASLTRSGRGAGIAQRSRVHPVVEPDGLRGHWIGLDEELWNRLGLSPGDEVAAARTPQSRWPEVVVPADMQLALAGCSVLAEVWQELTPMAHWEWVPGVKSTKNAATRARRVEVTLSKLESGLRRPCCFDRSSCTDPEVSSGAARAVLNRSPDLIRVRGRGAPTASGGR